MSGFYEDPSLVRKYGRRMQVVNHPYITESISCFYYAKSLLIRLNAARFVGTITILGRPELRMHMPIYIPTRNMIYYITGIDHNLTFGGTFTTSLQLKYGHKPWEVIPEILDYNTEQSNLNSSGDRKLSNYLSINVERPPVDDLRMVYSWATATDIDNEAIVIFNTYILEIGALQDKLKSVEFFKDQVQISYDKVMRKLNNYKLATLVGTYKQSATDIYNVRMDYVEKAKKQLGESS
jgi:hypothetical protein